MAQLRKYVLAVYFNGAQQRMAALPEDERAALIEEFLAFFRRPEIRDGNQLQEPATATTVRQVAGATVRSTGPVPASTGEPLGGYYLVEAADLEAALALAERFPTLRLGSAVEVRPVLER